MKDLDLGGTQADFSHHTVHLANVYLDGCPESDGSSSCMDVVSSMVYAGTQRQFDDDVNLLMFTGRGS